MRVMPWEGSGRYSPGPGMVKLLEKWFYQELRLLEKWFYQELRPLMAICSLNPPGNLAIVSDVIEDSTPLFDSADDRGKVVVGQHHVGGFLGHIGAGDAHGDADIGRPHRWRVVDAVASHGHDLSASFPRTYDA